MITRQDIKSIFSDAYAKASLRDDCDMRLVADLFESLRMQLIDQEPFDIWELLHFEENRLPDSVLVELLIDIRSDYFIKLFENILNNLDEVYRTNRENALLLWDNYLAKAAVYFRDDLICLLCLQKQKWGENDQSLLQALKLPKLIRESRWPDVFNYYEGISMNNDYSDEIRCYAELTLFQIVIYEYLEYSQALVHLEKAQKLLPENFYVKKSWGEYYLKNGETQKARDQFFRVMAEKPEDYVSLNLIGDSYLYENNLESAESWYLDAIRKNKLQNDSFRRLINLYSINSWFKDKEPQTGNLLEEIVNRPKLKNFGRLIQKGLATKHCYTDFQLYQAYRSIGAAWFGVGETAKAEEWYNKAFNLQPEAVAALVDLAYLNLQIQLPEKAKELLDRANNSEADNFDVYWALAYFYQTQKETENALKTYLKCIQIRPNWEDMIYNFIGNLYYSLKEYNKALVYYKKAIEKSNNVQVYNENLAGAYQGLAELLQAKQDFSGAEENFILAARTNNNDGNRWNILGNFYFGLQRWEAAVENYLKAIEIKKDPVFIENCGLAYERMGQLESAGKYYLMASEFDLVTGKVFNRLGVFYHEQKDYEKAIHYYLKALERQPEEPLYIENIAIAYSVTGNYDAAITNYHKVLEFQPANSRVMNSLGVAFYNQGQYEPAIEYYRKAIEIENTNYTYLKNLGLALRMTYRYDESLEFYNKALEVNRDDFLIWNEIGILYYLIGDQENAIIHYKKAIEIQPADPVLYNNLALALNAQGKTYEALHVTDGYPVSDELKNRVKELTKADLPWLFETGENAVAN